MTNVNKTRNSLVPKTKELDLGERRVSRMNFSYVTTLPKTFVNNCLGEKMAVKMTMLEDGCLKLTPVSKTIERGEEKNE